MPGVLDSQPDPELIDLGLRDGVGPERRVSSPPPERTVSSPAASGTAAPHAAQKRAPVTPFAPQDGQYMWRHSTIGVVNVDYEKARRHLIRHDPALGALVKRFGPCGLETTRKIDRFAMTVRSIVSQQLSVKAASTIHDRMLAALETGRATPEAILAIDQDRLRACGMSWAKIASVRDLATRVTDGSLALDALDGLDDTQVVDALTAVRGIGQWSAEMFLIFRLGRPDILPVGDVGVQRAMRGLYGLRKHPSPARMTALARPWRPYRSIACWYLWRSLD